MATKLIMVKVVFEYLVKHFRKGENEPYLSYTEKYSKTKAFDENKTYTEILLTCQREIENSFEPMSIDKDDNGKDFKALTLYCFPKLISYQILAEED